MQNNHDHRKIILAATLILCSTSSLLASDEARKREDYYDALQRHYEAGLEHLTSDPQFGQRWTTHMRQQFSDHDRDCIGDFLATCGCSPETIQTFVPGLEDQPSFNGAPLYIWLRVKTIEALLKKELAAAEDHLPVKFTCKQDGDDLTYEKRILDQIGTNLENPGIIGSIQERILYEKTVLEDMTEKLVSNILNPEEFKKLGQLVLQKESVKKHEVFFEFRATLVKTLEQLQDKTGEPQAFISPSGREVIFSPPVRNWS